MKRNILEYFIKKILVEQPIYPDPEPKQTEFGIEVPDSQPYFRRVVIKPANRTGLQFARQHGAVLDAWSAFLVKIKVTKTGMKYGVKDFDSSDSAARAMNAMFTELGKSGNYGPGSTFDVSENGIAKYMYIVGPNVSKLPRHLKFNVWVCNYQQLYKISEQLNKKEPLEYFDRIQSLRSKATIGNIPVLTMADANSWFSALQKYAQIQNFTLPKPVNSKVLIPELQYLSEDYEPEDVDIQTKKLITITDDNYHNYDTDFRGTAELGVTAFGDTKLTFINGTGVGVNDRNNGEYGIFTGEFKNGAPYKGKIEYADGKDPYNGLIDNIKVFYPDGSEDPTFSYSLENSSTTSRTNWERIFRNRTKTVSSSDDKLLITVTKENIAAMLNNNPTFVKSFSKDADITRIMNEFKTYISLADGSTYATGTWDSDMETMSMILNATFDADNFFISGTKNPKLNVITALSETTITAIKEYQTTKIPVLLIYPIQIDNK